MALTPEEIRARACVSTRKYNARIQKEFGVSACTRWRQADPARYRRHLENTQRRWRTDPAVRARHKDQKIRSKQKLRLEVYVAYGGARCSCCGETTLMFLTLDHANNDGAQDRKIYGKAPDKLFRVLRDSGFPPGYQVLCYNCNCGRARNGGTCPHQEKTK